MDNLVLFKMSLSKGKPSLFHGFVWNLKFARVWIKKLMLSIFGYLIFIYIIEKNI